MDVPLNAEVACVDGVGGKSTRLVVKPNTMEITHVVVRDAHGPHEEHLVPLEWVRETAPDRIDLRCTREALRDMDSFIDTRFVKIPVPEYFSYGAEYAWSFREIDVEETVPVEHEQLPDGELAVRKGARVEASDGHIGRIDELLIDPVSHKITHLVLRKGHLWGQRDVVIPIDQVERIGEEVVHLKLDKQAVEALPTSPAHA